jgi:diamine N-acetyltransferase
MSSPDDKDDLVGRHRDQMLKLVAKGFFHELVNYGVDRAEILRVVTHLLGHVLAPSGRPGRPAPDAPFTVGSVRDAWAERRELEVDGVTLRPFEPALVAAAARWLREPSAREGFVPAFPEGEAALGEHFRRPDVDYFGIYRGGAPVGFIGGEGVDRAAGKVEMKKLVGEPELQGRGIGKRATFGFLYYAFVTLGLHKVYVHSRDINVRNIGLNSGLGFELEGVFLEDVWAGDRRADVVRMALLQPLWLALFGGGGGGPAGG